MIYSLLVLLLSSALVQGWTNNGLRPSYPRDPILIKQVSTLTQIIQKEKFQEVEEIADIGSLGWESLRRDRQWVMMELGWRRDDEVIVPDVYQIWRIRLTQDIQQGEQPRNQRMQFMGTLHRIDDITEELQPDPASRFWNSFYQLEGTIYTESINIHITNHQGIARVLALYSEHDQGMAFKSIEIYGYLKLTGLKVMGPDSSGPPRYSVYSKGSKMYDDVHWKKTNYYKKKGPREIYFCIRCLRLGQYPREHPAIWTIVISSMHFQQTIKDISIYAANRNPVIKQDNVTANGFPFHRVQSVYNLTQMSNDTGVEIIALKEPIFSSMFLFLSPVEFVITEIYVFGQDRNPIQLGDPSNLETSEALNTSIEIWKGDHPAKYLNTPNMFYQRAPIWQVKDPVTKIWMYIKLGKKYRIVHVAMDVIVQPHHKHHVEIGVFQTEHAGSPENASYIPILNTKDGHRKLPTPPNYIDGELGFYSSDVAPSMIALEVMFAVFIELWPGAEPLYIMKLSTLELISLGENQLCDFRPGELHMRDMVNAWDRSFVGATMDLECDSEAFNVMCPECDTLVECVEEKDSSTGAIQAYWNTNEYHKSLCYESHAQMCLTKNILRDIPNAELPPEGSPKGAKGAKGGTTLECEVGYQLTDRKSVGTARPTFKTYKCHVGKDNLTKLWRESDQVCTDLDECADNICGSSGSCENSEGSYSCICNKGYEKKKWAADQCKDVDECVTNTHNCDCKASCVNTYGSFYCKCTHGYSGNGMSCEENLVEVDDSFLLPIGFGVYDDLDKDSDADLDTDSVTDSDKDSHKDSNKDLVTDSDKDSDPNSVTDSDTTEEP